MRTVARSCAIGFFAICLAAGAPADVEFASPWAPPSRMAADGSIVEDWGTFRFVLKGEGLPAPGAVEVSATRLDGVIPGAVARMNQGPLKLETTVFRSPTYPSGTDVVTVRIQNTSSEPVQATFEAILPDGARVNRQTVTWGGRVIVALPVSVDAPMKMREWGSDDDSTPMPGWGKPAVECDPAFRNIRAGLGGVPIVYRFGVQAGAAYDVVLGFMESHWSSSGQRPFIVSVEGCPAQTLDPIARWGQHKPGALLFRARDADNDGRLTVSVLPAAGAPDLNPILNVIWIFPPATNPNLDQVILGRLNSSAVRMVDVGGQNDQSLYEGGAIQIPVTLRPGETRELAFLLGAVGGSAPVPGRSAWTLESLKKAARDVNRDAPAR